MKTLIAMALAAVMFVGAGSAVMENFPNFDEEVVLSEATAMVEMYDVDGSGELSDEEILDMLNDMQNEYDIQIDSEELEGAVAEATNMLKPYDVDGDGEFSYDEQLGLVQDVYKAYDNGEVQSEEFKQILEGYERKVNELNSYHDLLDEVGVPGANIQIKLRPDQD